MKHVRLNIVVKFLCLLAFSIGLGACSKDNEDLRTTENILGVWSPNENLYMEFGDNHTIHNLRIFYQDNERIGEWNDEVYYYEPGYNLVIYLTYDHKAYVYQIISLTDESLTWCWVKEISVGNANQMGLIIGEIIKEAQEGFKLDPGLYETFRRVPEDEFLNILENLNIMYPWDFE